MSAGAAAILSRPFERGGERAEGAGVSPTPRATRRAAPPETWRPSASVRSGWLCPRWGDAEGGRLREGGWGVPSGSPQAAGGG